MYFLPPFFITTTPPNMSTNSSDAWHLPCNRKINAQNINIVQFRRLIFSRRPASQRTFFEGRFITPLSRYCPKRPLMRSSRRTTPHVAESRVVDYATDACSLRRIFATFLADSSASLGRPYFYLIQSNGWKSLCLLTGLSVQDYSKLLLQSKLVRVRNNKDGSRSIRVDRDEWNLFLGRFELRGDIYGKGGRVELTDWYINYTAIERTMGGRIDHTFDCRVFFGFWLLRIFFSPLKIISGWKFSFTAPPRWYHKQTSVPNVGHTMGKGSNVLEWAPEDWGLAPKAMIVAYYFLFSP
jgi:hypothetical protein